ncbi:hypothetical protein ACFWOL_16020 [Streptomyces sp. NPDC058442]
MTTRPSAPRSRSAAGRADRRLGAKNLRRRFSGDIASYNPSI